VDVVELLLSNGADVHLKDIYGQTALDWAIHYKQPAVEAVLRSHIAHIAEQEAAEVRAVLSVGSVLNGLVLQVVLNAQAAAATATEDN
jgi:ankyrin repeat protein